MNSHRVPGVEVASALALGIALSLVAARGGRLLTFDGYHYCELAKQFTREWPDRFGNHWPFGWPLAGASFARLGLSAYPVMVFLEWISLGALLVLVSQILAPHASKVLVLCALAVAPILAIEIGSVLTELPFAAVTLGMLVCLGHWPSSGAIWGAALLAVAALSIRYAGILSLPTLIVWCAIRWRQLGQTEHRWTAALATCAAGVSMALLLALNLIKSGHLSGAARGEGRGLSALPGQLLDLAWSAPSALLADGLRNHFEPSSPIGRSVGGLLIAAMFALAGWAWVRPRSAFSRPLALGVTGYLLGMGVLSCIGEFDALHNGRTFLPVLAPLLILAAECARPVALAVGCCVLVVAGGVAAWRGISRGIAGDVRPAVGPIKTRVAPADLLAINDDAFSLAAYFEQPTRRTRPEELRLSPPEKFLVVAAHPLDREGNFSPIPNAWRESCERRVSAGTHHYLLRTDQLIVLERLRPD